MNFVTDWLSDDVLLIEIVCQDAHPMFEHGRTVTA